MTPSQLSALIACPIDRARSPLSPRDCRNHQVRVMTGEPIGGERYCSRSCRYFCADAGIPWHCIAPSVLDAEVRSRLRIVETE